MFANHPVIRTYCNISTSHFVVIVVVDIFFITFLKACNKKGTVDVSKWKLSYPKVDYSAVPLQFHQDYNQ